MLVLSRKVGERVVIGKTVVITVVAVCGPRVRLGVEAPEEVAVHREELYLHEAGRSPSRKNKPGGHAPAGAG